MHTLTINGVAHEHVPGRCLTVEAAPGPTQAAHPFGPVVAVGHLGYVRAGDDWLRFPLAELKRIRRATN